MNGFASHGLDEDRFAEKGSIVSAFDAFPKSKPEYVTKTSGGGKWTVLMLIISALLTFSELGRWWRGNEDHTFEVEKFVSRDLQVNLDMVVAMRCPDIHINVQDASGDRILASKVLKTDLTNWLQWVNVKGQHQLGHNADGSIITDEGWEEDGHDEGFGEEHVHDIIYTAMRSNKWAKTPKIKGHPRDGDSCRIFGSMMLNKVQGDFHVTARGHGYQEAFGTKHLEHSSFNFSHIVSEFSFGAFYPKLVNPLDQTVITTANQFHKSQYFMSVVPTIYTVSSPNPLSSKRTIFTNQYAVTHEDRKIDERTVPGIFFKYDIEPLMLTIEERRDSFLRFTIKVVNILSGVLVAGHWCFTLSEYFVEVLGKRRKRQSDGVLTGKPGHSD
ncbi:hypothetical protein VE01_02246 [Pseudogymnoascus verrucosus]|uniref:Endoplasmic reticulum-Golgi intermediate compartment protein n=1 Tax=Pseudogymnoascus verrucosus TaxID=342668 RepID=A0A1B8GVL9_9PEZI|nr:uncharacterized protein VE01_02246 [Pseudogymnoascus verrucosus]OBT99858.1 hypothetical protein VE01_02246 [Pseudogymnoascus verrucosus]